MKTILSDIKGTTSPTAIAEEFRAYLINHGAEFLSRAKSKVMELYRTIKRESNLDNADDVVRHIKNELERGNMRPDYLSLVGSIIVEGMMDGKLQTEVYPDVRVAFRDWKKNGKGVYTYSNGCKEMQVQLFRTSTQGDLSSLIDGYFDTADVGDKKIPDSYKRISDSIKVAPNGIVFLSDLEKELEAADKAGCQVRLVVRPGNKPVKSCLYQKITSFAQV